MNELNQLNIDNLTSLWKKMGVENHPEFAIDGFNISHTWPNRFWFDWNATPNQIAEITHCLHRLPARAIIPVWMGVGEQANQLERYLQDECFRILLQQLAMYLDLQSVPEKEIPALDIINVQTAQDLEAWTATASVAFGYWIDIAAIQWLAADRNTRLLLVKQDDQPAATALVYKTGEIIGVHLVGVRDSFRGQGIAKALMQHVIQLSIAMGGKYLTLQASAAGETLYRNLGFVAQFAIKSYQRAS